MMPAAQERAADDALLEVLREVTLGEYEIARELGRGGMATVYLAHDIALDRKVAIKVMSPALLLMGEGMVERFKREARTAASLSHPHIIPIYTVKSTGKSLFFVMKFIAGRSLESIIREVGPLPIPMVKAVLQQVGSALGFAHRHGIVHRDVKPANIMVDEEGWAIVTDFGIAKVAENRGLTMTGIAVGTPSYMSPEQCAAKDITGKSDQYSLGVVAYEMLSGKQPFEGDSAMAIMFAHFHEQPRPILEGRRDCPKDLAEAVMRMLEKGPDQRWVSLEDMIGAIGAAPLAHNDPTHKAMQELARRNSNRGILDSVPLPPTSPIPPGRRSLSEAATTPIPAPKVAAVGIEPARAELHVGDTLQLAAKPRTTSGTSSTAGVSWATSDAGVATISSTGLVTAVAAGAVTITASCEGASGTAPITITPQPVAEVSVNPTMRSLEVGQTLSLEVAVRDARGGALTGRAVEWRSANPSVATVTRDGTVKAVAPGTVEVTATVEGKSGAARLTVQRVPAAAVTIKPASITLRVGDTVTVRAIVLDARQQPLTDRQVEWGVAPPSLATVSAAGVVVAQNEGKGDLVVGVEGVRVTAPIEVKAAAVASVTMANPAPVQVGGSAKLEPVIKDAAGRVLSGRKVKWKSASTKVAAISDDGVVSGIAPGSSKVTAECEGQSWTVTVTVQAVPVAKVTISGMPDTLEPGTRGTLVATAFDAAGQVMKDQKFNWSSSNSAVAAVSSSGGLTIQAAGSATITAETGGCRATVELSVRAPAAPPQSITDAKTQVITPPSAPPSRPAHPPAQPPAAVEPTPSVVAGEAKRGGMGKLVGAAVVIAILAGGGYYLFRPSPIPPSPEPPVITEGPPPPVPVADVSVKGPSGPVTTGRTIQLGAQVLDSSGGELANRALTWSTSDSAVATVDPTGAVSTHKAGTAQITAASEGQSATFDVVVEAPAAGQVGPVPVATVQVGGVDKALDIGDSRTLKATVKDAKGGALADRTVVWSTADGAIATVSSAGIVTATGPGTTTIIASSEGKSAAIKLTVNPPPEPVVIPVAAVVLAPPTLALIEGQSGQLTAGAVDAKRGPLDRPIGWTTSNPDVATVGADGLVRAVKPGEATITAQSEGKSATARVTVKEAPPVIVPVATILLTATRTTLKVGEAATWTAAARDAKGGALPDRPLSWSSSDPKVANVANGLVTAVGPGKAEIRVEVEGKRQTQAITVEAAAPSGGGPVTPPPAVSALLPRRGVAAGGALSCGLTGSSGVVCWGGGDTGPAQVAGVSGAGAVVAGNGHACALASGGRAFCWGDNRSGQLGDGSTKSRTAPAPVAGDLSFSQISAGNQHTCGVADGKAYCWGNNGSGQLGDGSTSARRKPVRVNLKETVASISAGAKHTCAVTAAGKGYCWGDGFSGQLGIGSLDQQSEPYGVSGDIKWAVIAAGDEHTCGLAQGGKAYCWGRNSNGEVGDGSGTDRKTPAQVAGGGTYEEMSSGSDHTCAIDGGGALWCWGANKAGQLGDGTKNSRNKPTAVDGGPFRSVSAGNSHTCAITRAGEAACWGANDKGQLGDGTTEARATPGPVRAGP